jgi:hypothetical protein
MNKNNSRAMLNERIRLNGAIKFCGDCKLFKKCPKKIDDIMTYRERGYVDNTKDFISPMGIDPDKLDKKKNWGWKPHKTTVVQYDNENKPSCEYYKNIKESN